MNLTTALPRPALPLAVRIASMAIIAAAVLIAVYGMNTVILNDNAYSRLATVYALVHQGTWYLDLDEGNSPNPFAAETADKVMVRGHYLSSKPPLMPLLMAGLYWLLEKSTGLSFEHPADLKRIVQFFNIFFGILPLAALLYFFARISTEFMQSPWKACFLLLALAFGTQVLGFAAQLNNHVPGAALCVGATWFALGLYTGRLAPAPWRFVAFGLLGGLTHTFDLPTTIFIAALGLALFSRFPKQTLLWGGLGILPPLALQMGLLQWTTGAPLPVQTRKELYLYENALWRCPVGIDGLNESKPTYAFHLLIGRHGVFSLFPILLLGPIAAFAALRRPLSLRPALLLGAACCLALFAYYIKSTNNYGGAAYGFRWAIGAMPMLLLMAAPWLDTVRSKAAWSAIALLMAVSAYSCHECFRQPWSTDMEWTTRLLFGPAS